MTLSTLASLVELLRYVVSEGNQMKWCKLVAHQAARDISFSKPDFNMALAFNVKSSQPVAEVF